MINIKNKTNSIIALFLLCLLLCLIILSDTCFTIAKSTLYTCIDVIVPSLFLFLLLTDLLSRTRLIFVLSKLFEPIMRPLFNLPGQSSFVFFIGLVSGYPTSTKLIRDLYKAGKCTKAEAERMLTSTSNSSPSFITSSVAVGLFNEPQIGVKLLFIHWVSAIIVGFIFRFYKFKDRSPKIETSEKSQSFIKYNFRNIANYIAIAIKNSAQTVIMISGFIILFSVIINVLIDLKVIQFITFAIKFLFMQIGFPFKLAGPLVAGVIELTTGINTLSKVVVPFNFRPITASFLLGFSGISVGFQIAGVLADTDISLKPYWIGKIMHGVIASILTIFFIV